MLQNSVPARRGAVIAALVAAFLLVSSVRVLADMNSAQVSQATAIAEQDLARAADVAKAQRANYVAAAAVRSGGDETAQCCNKRARRNISTLSADELREVRGCLIDALQKLAGQLERLKAMQENRMFEYAAFSEAVRLLSTPKVGVVEAMQPIRTMLSKAKLAAKSHGERLVLWRVQGLTDDIESRMATNGAS